MDIPSHILPAAITLVMDDLPANDGGSASGLASPSGELSESQPHEVLHTYLNALPYVSESIEEMQQRLEFIIKRMIICIKVKDWKALGSWDGQLQWLRSISIHPSLTPTSLL